MPKNDSRIPFPLAPVNISNSYGCGLRGRPRPIRLAAGRPVNVFSSAMGARVGETVGFKRIACEFVRPPASASLPLVTRTPQATLSLSRANSTPRSFRASSRAKTVESFGSERPCSMACKTLTEIRAAAASSGCVIPARTRAATRRRAERSKCGSHSKNSKD